MPAVTGYVILIASIVVMALAMMLVAVILRNMMALVMRMHTAEEMPAVVMVVTMTTATAKIQASPIVFEALG